MWMAPQSNKSQKYFNVLCKNSDREKFGLAIKDDKIGSIFCYLIRHFIQDYSMFAEVWENDLSQATVMDHKSVQTFLSKVFKSASKCAYYLVQKSQA